MIPEGGTYQVNVVPAESTEQPRFEVLSALSLLSLSRPPAIFPGLLAQRAVETPQVSYAGIQVVEDDEARQMSPLGTPLFYTITFKGGTYRRFTADGKVDEVVMDDLRLPITSMVEVQRGKSITTTEAVSSGGTVKEIYSMEDWSVRINGIILDENNHPQGATTWEAMRERLLDWYDIADSIEVEGELLSRSRIYRLVLKNLQFGQVPGKPRFHTYSFDAVSDEPLELIIR